MPRYTPGHTVHGDVTKEMLGLGVMSPVENANNVAFNKNSFLNGLLDENSAPLLDEENAVQIFPE